MISSLIFLSDGQMSVVSDVDYLYLANYNWRVDTEGYVTGWIDGRKMLMHRVIAERMGADFVTEIDHINGNKLDNRRKNLEKKQ